MDKPAQPAPESEADLENIRRQNNERRAVRPESPVSQGDSREGVLAQEGELGRKKPPAPGS